MTVIASVIVIACPILLIGWGGTSLIVRLRRIARRHRVHADLRQTRVRQALIEPATEKSAATDRA